MKKILLYYFSLSVLLFVSQSCQETLEPEVLDNDILLKSASSAKQSYIVVLNDSELNDELGKLKGYEKKQNAVKIKTAKILKRAGINDGEIGHVYGTAIKGFSVKMAPGQLKKLETDPSVKYIEKDRIITLAPPPGKGKPGGGGDGGGTSNQETPWGITRVNGGITYAGANVAWVIDSGIDLDHPDLNVDVNRSKDFTGSRKGAEDENGHGTHVAGTIAAIDNNIGVIGVAAGATVISCRVLNRRGSGSFSWTVAALDYIATDGVGTPGDVVNMSLGPSSRYTDQAVDEAVQNVASLGINISIAAGNESDDCSFFSPARNNGNNIYTISASDSNDNWASFSNYGAPVDFCEPGYSVKSTYKSGGYATLSGTSMAAPHAAGLLLLGGINSDDRTVSGDPDGNADLIGIH